MKRSILNHLFVLGSFATLLIALVAFKHAQAQAQDCETLGWFPDQFGLKDHTIFTYNNQYYLASIDTTDNTHFAYGVSPDLCNWTELSPILEDSPPREWDENIIWAPHVFVENDTYYMFYTSVDPNFNQRIVLAISSNPADSDSWMVQTNWSFTPTHTGAVWNEGIWSDLRDPYVFKEGDLYYLLYTGRDMAGGIVGMATAPSVNGPWKDFGSILTLDRGIPESAVIWQANGGFYLFYNCSTFGDLSDEKYRFGPAPGGPWNKEQSLFPGWAHEIWLGLDAQLYTSYLTDYSVTIQPLIWDPRFDPARPFIGEQILETFLPAIFR